MFHHAMSVGYIILKQNYLNVMGQYKPEILKIWVIVGAQYNENLSVNHHKRYIFLNFLFLSENLIL